MFEGQIATEMLATGQTGRTIASDSKQINVIAHQHINPPESYQAEGIEYFHMGHHDIVKALSEYVHDFNMLDSAQVYVTTVTSLASEWNIYKTPKLHEFE